VLLRGGNCAVYEPEHVQRAEFSTATTGGVQRELEPREREPSVDARRSQLHDGAV
jgi:hypothetical protein